MNIFKKYRELQHRVRILEFKDRRPQPYKVGDKFSKKDCIVTKIEPYHLFDKFEGVVIHDDIYWRVDYTNTKTGYTGYELM